jgi:energy-coupling factor transporter ATP-binding protein EcfA2
MWVEELSIENIRCFESATLRFASGEKPYPWVTFLSENGGGKSTALQALGLLLAGPEGAQKLVPRPVGWLRDEGKPGKIGARIHQADDDPGKHGTEKVRHAFGYSYTLTGTQSQTVNKKLYTEPSIVPAGQKILSWLRENAFASKGTGWFSVGYGAFRRLTRSTQIIVPSLEPQARFTNFTTQFDESEPLSVFERWMVYLDYRIAKNNDSKARQQKEMGIQAINRVLPEDAKFYSVTPEGRILFDIGGQKVPTISLSDGYRSILALAGDLIWRLILAFPESIDPLIETGVVLIDELDIHLRGCPFDS